MRDRFRVFVPVVAGYLLGSIPTAVVVGRRRHVDLRRAGDHNPGWWNAREELGARAALPVLLVDIAKGTLAAGLGRAVARRGEWWSAYLGGAAAMVGHAWPVFARFRGGRGVATLGGVAPVVAPASTAVALAAGLVVGRTSGSAVRGIRVGYAVLPVAQLVVDGTRRTAATGALMSLIGVRFWTARR